MFAQKIRELRMARGLSEAALDEIFDLMRGTVSNWEHGYAVFNKMDHSHNGSSLTAL